MVNAVRPDYIHNIYFFLAVVKYGNYLFKIREYAIPDAVIAIAE